MKIYQDDDVRIGDEIVVGKNKCTITKIYSSFYWDRFGWDIEFLDQNGNYRHWKQHLDGGKLFMKGAIEC